MRLFSLSLAAAAATATPWLCHAQSPVTTYADAIEMRFDPARPAVGYTVRVDPADLSGFSIEMRLHDLPDTVRLALPIWAPGAYRVANFSRFVRDLVVQSAGRSAPVVREDSSVWRVVTTGGSAVVRYRIALPAEAARAATNRSFLRETGALLDGPASYLYVVGEKLLPAHVTFALPDGWRIATGLVPTADPRVFFAPSYDVLIDSPVLMGALRVWRFEVEGVPHRVAYWPLPTAPPFDSLAFVASLERIVRTGSAVMGGRVPYREYTFLFIDGAGGGLEHLNSTTIGAPSAALARDPLSRTEVSAHEYFHAWNVKRARPAVLGPFDYQHPVRTTDLWWSEGVTDYFANEIERRVGWRDEDAARAGLAASIESYLRNPAHARVSPQHSSWTAWDPPAVNGGYSISYYLQGQLIGELLEMQIRDLTSGRRGMDDLMRLVFSRYGGVRGFTGEDLLHAANEVCGCDLEPFFDRHIAGAAPLDFARYLALAGWTLAIERRPAVGADGTPLPDLRIGVIPFGGIGSAGGAAGNRPRLTIADPSSAWGRAGIAGGDEIITMNGRAISGPEDFAAALANARIGDVVQVVHARAGERRSAAVTLTGYETVRVTLTDVPQLTERQRMVRRLWLRGPRPSN